MRLSTRTRATLALATALSLIGAVAWAQNLEVKGSAWFATGGSGSAGIGTNAPVGKLHVVAPGSFGPEDANGVSQPGGVPIVAQSDSTAFGVLNSSGRQVFAINVEGNGLTSASRGNVIFYDRTDGAWHPGFTMSRGAVGFGRVPAGGAGNAKVEVDGEVLVSNGWLRTEGATGWYSQTYGGGWYMSDSAWVRSYADKGLWTGAGLLANDGGLSVGYGGAGPPTQGAILAGSVGIGTSGPAFKLDVRGPIGAGGSDLYFTDTAHNHSGIGNTAGYAAIENAANLGTLMILGRAGTSVGRRVDVWDYLQVNGRLRSTTGTVVYTMYGRCATGGALTTAPTCTYCSSYSGSICTFFRTVDNAIVGRVVDY